MHVKLVAERFNQAQKTYDKNCHVQRDAARLLVDIYQQHVTEHNVIERIMDCACGTGVSTQYLDAFFQTRFITAIDVADKLLLMAKKRKYKNTVIFLKEDFNYSTVLHQSMDLVFSSMGFQWSDDFEKTFLSMYCYLKPGGLLLFSMPVVGTFDEIKPDKRLNFLSIKVLLSHVVQAGFDIIHWQVKSYTDSFPSAFSALRSIKLVGAGYVPAKLPAGLQTGRALDNVFHQTHQVCLTQRIVFILARRRSS